MNQYRVSNRRTGEAVLVIAQSFEAAAQQTIGKKLKAIRVSGDTGKSGLFQGYTQMRGGGLNSSGDQFHIMMEIK